MQVVNDKRVNMTQTISRIGNLVADLESFGTHVAYIEPPTRSVAGLDAFCQMLRGGETAYLSVQYPKGRPVDIIARVEFRPGEQRYRALVDDFNTDYIPGNVQRGVKTVLERFA